jgi:hypothetical protein
VEQPSKILDVKMPPPRFITFKLHDPKKSTRDINPLYAHKALHGIAGKFSKATLLKNRTLLNELFNEKQAEVLLEVILRGSHPVHVGRHMVLNSSRVSLTDILHGMSDKKIQMCLARQFISKAYRLIAKKDGKPFFEPSF